MMKYYFGLLVLGGLFFASCEDQVVIQDEPFETKPVIYCVINPADTIHYIRVERIFSGYEPPAITAQNHDSLYFNDVKIRVGLSGSQGCTLDAECVEVSDKKSGYFEYERHYLYRFKKVMQMRGGFNVVNNIHISVDIPGLPKASGESAIINNPRVYSPNPSQQMIYIFPDNPLRVQWDGGDWNELDITFEIEEMYADTLVAKTIAFQKINDVHINGKYYEVRIPHDLVVQELDKKLKVNNRVIRRYFGPVNFTIHTGLDAFAKYIEYLGGINDFNENPYSTINNGFGLITSRSSIVKGPFYLDQASRLEFAQDSTLKKFKFIEY